jgi:hypothetical protein
MDYPNLILVLLDYLEMDLLVEYFLILLAKNLVMVQFLILHLIHLNRLLDLVDSN